MKPTRKNGGSRKGGSGAGFDDPEIEEAISGSAPGKGGNGTADPFADFMSDFYTDPQKPLKFLRSFMAGEDAYSPAVDVVEEKDKLTVIVDLPGVAERDLRVEFVEGGVVLRGKREPAPEPSGSRMRRAERPAGEFSKTVPLPKELDVRSVVAKMESGVLTLTIPRSSASDLKSLKAGTT